VTRPIVEIAFGYSLTSASPVRTDITQYVDLAESGISTSRGAQDELSETQPGTATLTLDNSDGRFTAARTTSAYYPSVKKNVPIWVSIATMDVATGAAPWPIAQLSDDFDDGRINAALWTTAGGATETNGRMRLPVTPGVTSRYTSNRAWTLPGSKLTAKLCTIPAAGGSSSASLSMYVYSQTSGTRFRWQYNALTGQLLALNEVASSDASPTSLTYSPVDHAWLRIREASGTVYFETSPDGFGWTVRRSLATPVWVASDQVQAEFAAFRSGGVADFAEWDLVGAEVWPRFYGMVNEWPLEWEGLNSKVTIPCTDAIKWTGINKELRPMLVEEILLDRPTAYYPLSEPADSTTAGDLSGTSGVGTLSIVQAGSGGTLIFDSGTGPSDDLGCPTFTPASISAGKYLTADLGQGFVDANLNFRVRAEAWFTTSTNGRVLMALASADLGTKMVVLLESGTGKLVVEKDQNAAGTQTYTFATPNLADGALHHFVYNEFANELYVDGVLYTLSAFNGTDLRTLTVGGFANTRLWAGTIAQVAVYCRSVTSAELVTHYTTGTTEHIGEAADVRMARLASYVGLTVTAQGSPFDAMASQKALGQEALTHMRQIETTESGKLLASRSDPSLVFQSRGLRYNPVPAISLEYADLETNGVKYADDDQKMINIVEASRQGGATQRIINQDAVSTYGPYKQTLDLFKNSDNSVTDAANWLVSRYSDPPPEIRQVPVEAYSMPLATYRALLAADVSTVLALTGLPDQAPAATATVTVEGYTETISLSRHLIDFHTSRADTDNVWILDDSTYSILGSTTRLAY
jgi:hypothetical protein